MEQAESGFVICVIWFGMKLRQQALGLEGNQEKLCYDLK